ncbi:hypothetical protein HYX58_00700 [Candidatus Dependentiae bacterium]|nr:hypothetical protein [Candidatus Dependentiae bacterium]
MIKRYTAALLMVFLVVSINAKDDKKIIELKEKEQQLHALNDEIIEKEQLISFMEKRIRDQIVVVFDQKEKELKKIDEEKKFDSREISSIIEKECRDFFESLEAMQGKDKKFIATNFLFSEDDRLFDKDIDVLKYFLIRYGCELVSLKELLKRWEIIMREIASLGKKIIK